MPLIVATVLIGAGLSAQEPKTYRDESLGLSFQYPAGWTLEKQKYSDVLTFPLADGSQAQVQMFRTAFRQDKSVWQNLQREVSDQLNRTVTRQWEELILGVPMLMSRIDYRDQAGEKSILVGLLYTATDEKLNFRLNSSAGAAMQAEQEWRRVLLTLRTLSGEMPKPEDPARVSSTTTTSGQGVTTLRPNTVTDPVRTKNTFTVQRLGQDLRVYLPDSWTMEENDGRLMLTVEKLNGTVELLVSSGGRPQLAGALKSANVSSFSKFSIVSLRDDPNPKAMKSGCFVASTLRAGTDSDGGFLAAWHAVGTSGTLIWRIDYSCSSQRSLDSDKKAMEKLFDLLALEIVR